MEKSWWQKAYHPNWPGILLPLAVLLLAGRAVAADVAGSSGAYLRPPVGAAATALGGAYTAQPVTCAAWWNPAILGFLRERRIDAGAGLRSLGRREGWLSFDFPVPPRVGMGLLALYRGDPSLDNLYDLDEQPLPAASYTTLTFKGAVSYYLTRKMAVGLCMGVLYQRLPVYGESNGLAAASATSIGTFDFACAYRASSSWTVSAVLKNMGANMVWQMGDRLPPVKDQPLPEIALGSGRTFALAGKPLLWLIDCKAYLFDGSWKQLDRPEALLSTGAEWQRWDNFSVRAGIGDVPLNGDILHDRARYGWEFNMRVALGFSYNVSKFVHRRTWINYGAATDKVWAGIEQQLDVTMSF